MTSNKTIFIAGFFSFLLLNIFENVLHYSIGRSHQKSYQIVIPSKMDFIKIVFIMFAFAVLQGGLTMIVNYYEN
jgi:hypothetical protein